MRAFFRIVALVCLALPFAADSAQEKVSVGIIDALAATKNFQGITGMITMDRNGDPVKPIPVLKFEDGGSILVKTVTP